MQKNENFYTYSGLIHIHTDHSDGNCSCSDVITEAQKAEYDFIVISDHNTLNGKKVIEEIWYDKLFVIFGYEYNDINNNNHLLIFDSEKTYDNDLSIKDVIKESNKDGCFSYMCHPFEKRKLIRKYRPYPWTEWDLEDNAGFEIVNFMSMWLETISKLSFIFYILFPYKVIHYPGKIIFDYWKNRKKKAFIIGSLDAHQFKFFGKIIFPLRVLFKTFSTYIQITNELDKTKVTETKKSILHAIKNGNSFVVNHLQGKAKSFKFWASDENSTYNIGSEISVKSDSKITLSVEILNSPNSLLKIFHNNEMLHQSTENKIDFCIKSKGMYRVEVWKKNKWWIISNPIYLR